MRLIDADKINFEEVFGGQSDFAKDLRKAAQELIGSQPTAFDKEKVIEKLKRLEVDSFKYYNKNDDEQASGESTAYRLSIEIVEKGEIEQLERHRESENVEKVREAAEAAKRLAEIWEQMKERKNEV